MQRKAELLRLPRPKLLSMGTRMVAAFLSFAGCVARLPQSRWVRRGLMRPPLRRSDLFKSFGHRNGPGNRFPLAVRGRAFEIWIVAIHWLDFFTEAPCFVCFEFVLAPTVSPKAKVKRKCFKKWGPFFNIEGSAFFVPRGYTEGKLFGTCDEQMSSGRSSCCRGFDWRWFPTPGGAVQVIT
jgi:hypothetical protein